MHPGTDTVAHQIADDIETVRLYVALDRVGNVTNPISDDRLANPQFKGFTCDAKESFRSAIHGGYRHSAGVVADEAPVLDDNIKRNEVPLPQYPS